MTPCYQVGQHATIRSGGAYRITDLGTLTPSNKEIARLKQNSKADR